MLKIFTCGGTGHRLSSIFDSSLLSPLPQHRQSTSSATWRNSHLAFELVPEARDASPSLVLRKFSLHSQSRPRSIVTMSFNDLSNELVLEILEWVREDFFEGTRSLHNLAASSRRLNILATPILYRTFCLPHSYTIRSLHVFLKVVTERPDLRFLVSEFVGGRFHCGEHCRGNPFWMRIENDLDPLRLDSAEVQSGLEDHREPGSQNHFDSQNNLESQTGLGMQTGSVSRSGLGGRGYESLQPVSIHTDENLMQYRKLMAVITSVPIGIERWINALLAEQWHAVFALLLLSLSNPKRIEIESLAFPNTIYVDLVLRAAIRNQKLGQESTFLNNLRSVSFGRAGGGDNMFPVHEVVSYLKLSSVSTLCLYQVVNENFIGHKFVSDVKELNLNDSNIAGEVLVQLLRCIPKLQKLEYSVSRIYYEPSDFHPQMIGEAISHLRPCLEQLILDSGLLLPNARKATGLGSIGSLAGFEKLHEVSIEVPALLGRTCDVLPSTKPRLVNVLPKSLRTLSLHSCSFDLRAQVYELLKRKDELVPLLASLRLDFRDDNERNVGPVFDVAMQDLKNECKLAGVRFDYDVSHW